MTASANWRCHGVAGDDATEYSNWSFAARSGKPASQGNLKLSLSHGLLCLTPGLRAALNYL